MRTKEYRSFKLELRDLEEDTGVFTGYASTFGRVDAYNDFIEPGAFKKTLKENKGKVPIFYMHKTDQWIGLGQSAKEDDKGLLVEAKLDIGINQRARETFSLMKMSADANRPAGLSIGFETVQWEMNKNIRHLKEIKLWEYSPTPPGFHADYGAMIAEMKTVVPYQNLPLADADIAWQAGAAIARIRNWAGGDDINFAKYRQAFLWYDDEEPELQGSYKLPIADVIGGGLKAVPRGIYAAAAVLQGARGGVNIPAADIAKCKTHLDKYYKRLEKEPPWSSKNVDLYIGPGIVQSLDISIEDDLYALVLADIVTERAATHGTKPGNAHSSQIKAALNDVLSQLRR